MGEDCGNCGQPQPFDYEDGKDSLSVAKVEIVTLKVEVQRHVKDANNLEHALGKAERELAETKKVIEERGYAFQNAWTSPVRTASTSHRRCRRGRVRLSGRANPSLQPGWLAATFPL